MKGSGGGAGGAIIIFAISVVVVLAFVCPLTDGSDRPLEQKLEIQLPRAPNSNPVLRFADAWLNDEASKRETAAQLAALQVTRQWIAMNATPTPAPTWTPTPEPTWTPAPTSTPVPTFAGTIKETTSILAFIFWSVIGALVTVMAVYVFFRAILPALTLKAENWGATVNRDETGNALMRTRDGRITKTQTMVGSELVPERDDADDALVQVRRVKHAIGSGFENVDTLPARRLSLTDAPDATANQRVALGIASQVSAGMAVALKDKLDKERLAAMRVASALAQGRRDTRGLLEAMKGGQDQSQLPAPQWSLVKPEDIRVLTEPAEATALDRRQVVHLLGKAPMDQVQTFASEGWGDAAR